MKRVRDQLLKFLGIWNLWWNWKENNGHSIPKKWLGDGGGATTLWWYILWWGMQSWRGLQTLSSEYPTDEVEASPYLGSHKYHSDKSYGDKKSRLKAYVKTVFPASNYHKKEESNYEAVNVQIIMAILKARQENTKILTIWGLPASIFQFLSSFFCLVLFFFLLSLYCGSMFESGSEWQVRKETSSKDPLDHIWISFKGSYCKNKGVLGAHSLISKFSFTLGEVIK